MLRYATHLLAGAFVCTTMAHASEVYCDSATQHITHYYVAALHRPKANAAIFRGQLLDIYTDSSLVVYRGMGVEHPVFYRFQVLESWAPSNGPQHYITALTYADKRLPLQQGTEYLIATMGTTRGAFLWLDRCDLLKPLQVARPELHILGPGTILSAPKRLLQTDKKRVSASTAVRATSSVTHRWVIGVALLTALNLMLLVWLCRRMIP